MNEMTATVPPAGFEAGALLAQGGLSVTFVVTRAGGTFVCKRLAPRAAAESGAHEAARDEARVLGMLEGRGAPRLVAHGEDAHGIYLVQALVAGEPLSAWIRLRERPAEAPFAPSWLGVVARAAFVELAAIHGARDIDTGEPLGLVHGDISTENVLATASSVSIVDFGLARFRGALRPEGSAFRGTARYAAPELARGEPIDARADLFAMAATLLHLGARTPPHEGASGAALLLHAGDASLEAYARTAGAFFSADVARALARCVAFERDDRPLRAEDVFGPNSW